MIIRAAGNGDVARVVEIINAAYRKAESHFIEGDRMSEAELRNLLRDGIVLIAEDQPGNASACVYLRRNGDRVYLGLLSVDPGRQKQGLGRRLLDAAEAYCLEHGCHAIDIVVVNLRTELFSMYEARGYRRTGTAPFEDPRLTRAAHFVRMSKVLADI